MERLIIKPGICANASTEYCESQEDCYLCQHGKQMRFRLSDYEDTGMPPSEIMDMKGMFHSYRHICAGLTPERLKELVEADREGRVAMFPCKQNDVLWTFCTYPNKNVYSFCVTDISYLNGMMMLNTDKLSVINAEEIGKNVFLTREAAEKALEDINAQE